MTRRHDQYSLIGDPVSHSLSPFIMTRAFAAHGIKASYTVRGTSASDTAATIRDMQLQGFAGTNVTYPLKEIVIESVDKMTPEVAAIGAANTLRFEDGVVAHNTDAVGTKVALETIGEIHLGGKLVVIFGAGGSGRAAAYGLLEAGVDSVSFVVRNPSGASSKSKPIEEAFPNHRVGCYDRSKTHECAERVSTADILINATPIGMNEGDMAPFDEAWIRSHHTVFDFVYGAASTRLQNAAEETGARVLDGLALLVAQAQASFHFWTGKSFLVREMFAAVQEHVKKQVENR